MTFQRKNDLTVTGVVGERTWRRLDAARAARSAADARQAPQPRRQEQVRASRDESRSLATAVLDAAARLKGKPYRYGATGPDAFDCSGYTGYVFRSVGVQLPRTSQEQRNALPHVSREDARPGDLLFSHDSSGRVYHVAVYAGSGQIWDSSRPGEHVAKRDIWTSRVSFGRPS